MAKKLDPKNPKHQRAVARFLIEFIEELDETPSSYWLSQSARLCSARAAHLTHNNRKETE
ncbi:hypothetical protein SEA_AJAY_48 [Mycobacterium phage Ajay]|nr:hypothetical protein SEA_OOGWAY_45 [Mycobacterium phage Oogway]QDP44783.1 hypothetical protein SEA_AJAY_48 [Mycobacterium phage Ajay]